MKTNHQLAVLALAVALGFGATVAVAQTDNAGHQRLGKVLGARWVTGKEVKNPQGERIGKIEDFVVDLESGRILYVLVSNGKLGSGQRAAPPEIFSPTADAKAFVVPADKQKLSDAPTVNKDTRLGQIDLVTQIYQHFGQNPWWEGPASDKKTFANVHRASEFVGKAVKDVSDQDFGRIENVMVDMPAGRVVYALLATKGMASGEWYTVPPNAFTLNPDRKYLVTGIDRSQLASAPKIRMNNLQELSNPAFAGSVYHFYGKDPYFDTNAVLSPTSDRPKQ